ncbi:MAG: helix-turn-helix domain-containing protein [Eubacteriales bacterium]|nr:helix-turn-helix domain-containing protein [Eubacteriales bacterium]
MAREREKAKFDILDKIMKERKTRNWTEYTLSQRAGLPQSTISTWYRKDLQPSVASIEKVCGALDISLSQFFADYQDDGTVVLNDEQKELLTVWDRLSGEQRSSVLQMLEALQKKG